MIESKLIRGLGRWDLTAVAVNTVIGTGIFILPAGVFKLIGSYSLIAFLACAVIVGLIVVCFSEVSSRFTTTGGMYLYAREAFGPEIGFETGWLYWVVRVATFAANCNAVIIYLGFFFDDLSTGIPRTIIITIVVVGTTVVNLLGVRPSAVVTNIFTVGKLVPLLLFVAAGIFYIQPANFDFSTVPEYANFPTAILLLIYAYVGFEAAVIPAGETKDPGKNVPFALLTALGFCVILFFLVQLVAIGTLPALAESKTPLADAAGSFMGPAGAAFIVIGAFISVLGNLNGGFLSSSRIPFAMAERGELPKVLASTHPKYKTPFASIIVTGAVILALTIFTSFLSAVTIATTTRLLVYATTCLALPVFRQRTDVPPARFSVPLGILASVLSITLIVWLLIHVDFAKEGLPILIASGLGIASYYAYRKLAGAQTSEAADQTEA